MGEVLDEGGTRGAGATQARAKGIRPYSWYIEGKPHPKERPRFTKTGIAYTPEKTRLAEKRLGELYDGPKFDGPIAVNIVFDAEGVAVIIEPVKEGEKSKLRGDLDNYLKTVLDGLNGVAWGDDVQIVKITAVKI